MDTYSQPENEKQFKIDALPPVNARFDEKNDIMYNLDNKKRYADISYKIWFWILFSIFIIIPVVVMAIPVVFTMATANRYRHDISYDIDRHEGTGDSMDNINI